ncbi:MULTISPECIES: amino acid ABC transporter permease [unclassified Rhizobium]|uniref:amino acid ABC transporter permease n=1 Tax=unclassified Rhizobium TaxID=2613769 RepID=UPI00247AB126|nr:MULTISPECIES: amino acid ABC transporter permease [unclassified Rhizobium]MDH7800792.1 polar amino acid transport system permease protein [Rhizobium sp. AN70]
MDFRTILTGEYGEFLLEGVRLTLMLFVSSWVLSISVALLLTWIGNLQLKSARFLVLAYVEYHRNVPLLVQLFIWYFAIPQLFPAKLNLLINSYNAEFFYALIAIGLCNAAYVSEDLRSGLRAIPKVQYEAARAAGFSYSGSLIWIILPQAWRLALPPLVNQSLVLFKSTSLAAVIGVGELSYQARLIESQSFLIFETFTVITIAYLAGSIPLMLLGRHLGKSSRFQER